MCIGYEVIDSQRGSELDRMTEQGIIAPVTIPTPWVSSLVDVPKKDGKRRLYLDPKDLNQAIQRDTILFQHRGRGDTLTRGQVGHKT